MRPAFLGIIGCGAMGRLIARHIREQLPSYRLGGLFSRTTAHAEGLALELGDVPVLGLQQLIETCDLLVEATSAAAMPDIVRACLAAGKAVVPLSVGGFSLDPALLRDVEAARAAVHGVCMAAALREPCRPTCPPSSSTLSFPASRPYSARGAATS